MRVGVFEFRPTRWPTLAVVLMLPLLVGLGFWQLDRAAQKRALLEARSAGQAQVRLDLNQELPDPGQVMHRRARAAGRYDASHQFLLDNQVRKGEVGYRIITPLRLSGGERAVLVDRGWVAAPPRRTQLPDVSVDDDPRRLEGRLEDGPSVGLRLGDAYAGDGSWPRRIQYLDFQAMAQSLPYPVAPYLLTTAAQSHRMRVGPQRHFGYAVQWFALATALIVIYVGVNTRRRKRHE